MAWTRDRRVERRIRVEPTPLQGRTLERARLAVSTRLGKEFRIDGPYVTGKAGAMPFAFFVADGEEPRRMCWLARGYWGYSPPRKPRQRGETDTHEEG